MGAWLRALLFVLALMLPGAASAAARLQLRCDFCAATPTSKSPALEDAASPRPRVPEAPPEQPPPVPEAPAYPAPPQLEEEQPPVIVDLPSAPNPRIRLLEQELQVVDASLRELNQTIPAGPVLMGIGAALALIVGGPTGLVGLVLFSTPETFTAAIVLTTIGGVLTGMSVLLAILAYSAVSERREDSERLTVERKRIAEELEKLRAGKTSELPTMQAPALLTLRF